MQGVSRYVSLYRRQLEVALARNLDRENRSKLNLDKDGNTMSRTETLHIISGYHLGETGKAVRFCIHEVAGETVEEQNGKTEWFPLSQVRKMTRSPAGSNEYDTLTVTEWILNAKELI